MSESLFPRLAAALATPDIEQKLAFTAAIAADWQAGLLDWQGAPAPALSCGIPDKPELVPPKLVPQRSPQTEEGRARLLHAIVHIEFSAINLALDHAARFPGLPKQYYADWIGVAAEEAYHFTILRERLNSLGYDYGDFPAHAGLWEMAMKTAYDALARMALVPRLLEARGLDATPPIQRRLEQAGDDASARVLDIILRDRPKARGIAVPGLPIGAPGREYSNPTCETACTTLDNTSGERAPKRELFDTLLVLPDGNTKIWARH